MTSRTQSIEQPQRKHARQKKETGIVARISKQEHRDICHPMMIGDDRRRWPDRSRRIASNEERVNPDKPKAILMARG